MQKPIHLSRLGGTAIAAVLALSAPPAFAQEVSPQEVPQATTPAPAPTVSLPTPTAEPATDPLAAEPTADTTTSATTATTTTKSTTARKASKPAAVKPSPRSTSVSTRSAAPAATSAPAATALVEPTPLPEALPAAPVATAAPPPPPAPVESPVATNNSDETLPIALGAGLGLLALGGAAFALRRRRNDVVAEDEVIVDEPTIARAPVDTVTATPAIADRSAFSWGAPAATAAATSTSAAGRTWVERAHDGPTPENPFLSLKKRLQRAAFYDQRERAVAKGKAKPLSPMAGLPSRFAAAMKPKVAPAPSYGFSYAPA